jgi:chloramphenicol 3-O-phosphotransferase
MKQPRIIFLHGPGAAGKYTIARELSRLTGLPLFHNHLTVDLLLALFPY